MTHQEEPKDFIAVNIEVTEEGAVMLTQPDIMNKIERFFYPDGNYPQRLTPLPPDYDQKKVSRGDNPKTATEFQQGMGIMGYCRITRNDVQTTLSRLAEAGKNAEDRDVFAQ